jgi:prepilin-type N-terminal cleavage/methylation domain-containing protein
MSRKNKRRKFQAFTIPELLVGVTIFAMIVMVAINAYATISQLWKESLVMNELSLGANTAIERMVHGKSANAGLLAAKSISAPAIGLSANSVDYTDALDVSRRFYHSEGKIYEEDGRSIISDIDQASIAASNIFLNVDDRMIRIVLALKKTAGRKEVKLRVETKVSLRN